MSKPKYSSEFKIMVAEAYLNGEGGLQYTANKYGVAARLALKIFNLISMNKVEITTYSSFPHRSCSFKFNLGFISHVFERLLPTISMYLTLIENDFTQEEALMIAQKEIQHHANNMAKENAKRFGKKLYRVQSNNIFRTSLYKYTELCRNGFHWNYTFSILR